MPANDKLLQYFDSIDNSDNNDDIDESTSIDDLISDIKDEPAPKVKPRIRVNIKPVNKPKPVAVDIDDVVSKDNNSKNNNASDIDAFLAQARAEAAEKQKKKDSNPFNQAFNQTTIPNKPKITTYDIHKEDLDTEDIVRIEEDDMPSVTELVKMSETSYTDEWLEVYEKAQNSKKKNYTTDKLKSGRFRINSDHQVEILADKNTYGMSADDMLNEKWT